MKALRITLLAGLALLAALTALLGGAWFWSGQEGSLATALQQVARHLPADQTLEFKDVQGSLRSGGSGATLHWQRGGLSVQLRDWRLGWSLRPLLDGELRLEHLTLGELRLSDTRPAAAPLNEFMLPLRVSAPFAIDALEWTGPAAWRATGLRGRYRFDGLQHQLELDSLQLAAGQYRAHGKLQAQAPMALALQVQGTLLTQLPSSQQPLTVQAEAELQGTLAGADATLQFQADLLPQSSGAKAMQASVNAALRPWQAQAVSRLSARWQDLDLAALWPQAPQTQLAGVAEVTPAGALWQAHVTLTNAQPGPWNLRRLPLEQLDARLRVDAGQWNLEALQAAAAGGRVSAQGQLSSGDASWQVNADLLGLNPAALDSRLAASALQGQLSARRSTSGIDFDAQLQAAPGAAPSARTQNQAPWQLRQLQAKGRWAAPLLTLQSLNVQSDDAQLQGQFSLQTLSRAAQGQLSLTLPGASAQLQGEIAPTLGRGELSSSVSDIALLTRWWARWPLAPPLPALLATAQGQASLNGHWRGGWASPELQVQLSAKAPQLDLQAAPALERWRLRELQAELQGGFGAWHLSLGGQAEHLGSRYGLQAQADGERHSEGGWQAHLNRLQLTLQDPLLGGPWTAQLAQGAVLDWRSGPGTASLVLGPGSLRLSGPAPGSALVQWQPMTWSEPLGTATRQWHSQGSVQGLPLAWLELVGRSQWANLRLRGDLLFDGAWDASSDAHLRAQATLQRSAGDLQLQTEDSSGPTLSAGVRQAQLRLSLEGEQATASLRWESERAGQLQADFGTRLGRVDGAWAWAQDAAVTGSLRAQLPTVGAWSLLVPPGWRLRGTLDANATLSGTRSAPQWRGSLQAQDLALRSVANGLDFSHGTLNARLEGQRLEIIQASLQGAGGSAGGLLTLTGWAQWLAPGADAAAAASALRVELELQAQGLHVSTRADQRLVLSGQVAAKLVDAQLTLRGKLKADQALFILPDDSAPELGEDVVVRRPAGSVAAPVASAEPARRRIAPDVNLTLDLGSDFQVRGRGLVTRLGGKLELRNATPTSWAPRLNGELNAYGGSYQAYGQQLDIEQGVLRFSGPYDNPALDILAIRPNLPQRVGVQLSGTALSPVVRLYAEPDLPEAEKLAWLVLGRTSANGGAEAAVLQQAALALLGGKGKGLSGGLAQALGLDELSLRGSATNAAGTTTAAAVTVGKRVSRNFYLAYERSLAGTMGTLYVFYDLSRRFTLRAQTGEQSAVDLIFTLRYD